MGGLAYPYLCPGPDDSTAALRILYKAGLYLSDLNKVQSTYINNKSAAKVTAYITQCKI